MFAVTAMHEQVHERTSQQREPENYAKQMGAMFCPKISADHGEQDDKNAGRHHQERAAPSATIVAIVCHDFCTVPHGWSN
jgi:hypothetical protein